MLLDLHCSLVVSAAERRTTDLSKMIAEWTGVPAQPLPGLCLAPFRPSLSGASQYAAHEEAEVDSHTTCPSLDSLCPPPPLLFSGRQPPLATFLNLSMMSRSGVKISECSRIVEPSAAAR
jgi:hypothetical protein